MIKNVDKLLICIISGSTEQGENHLTSDSAESIFIPLKTFRLSPVVEKMAETTINSSHSANSVSLESSASKVSFLTDQPVQDPGPSTIINIKVSGTNHVIVAWSAVSLSTIVLCVCRKNNSKWAAEPRQYHSYVVHILSVTAKNDGNKKFTLSILRFAVFHKILPIGL